MAENYKDAHLQWIANNPKFVPQYPPKGLTYLEVMKSLYSQPEWNRPCDRMNDMALAMFVIDKKWQLMSTKISKMVDKKVQQLIPIPNGEWFVTIGFNHQTWSVDKCVKAIQKIMDMDWVVRCKANFELYRENGEHPHCHFYIETKECKSKILDKIWRPKYIKELVLKKSFIDIKEAQEYHKKYIQLDKCEEKQSCIGQDKVWRKENNIPDFEKNW